MLANRKLERLRQQKQLLMAEGDAQRRLLCHDGAAIRARLQWLETPWKLARLSLPWLTLAAPLWQLWCTPASSRGRGSWINKITAGIALGQRLAAVWRRFPPGDGRRTP